MLTEASRPREAAVMQANGVCVKADPVRESMTVLPQFLQLPLTMLTGKPYAHQQGPSLSPFFHLASAYSSLFCGLVLSVFALGRGGWFLLILPLSWSMTLHGMRNLRMMIFHQSSHRNLFGRRRWDELVAWSISSMLIIQNFGRYSREHVADHHAIHHMTLRDPTVQAILISLKLKPGMSRQQMWRRVLGLLVSPSFHLRFVSSRVLSFAVKSSKPEKALAITFYGGMLTVTALNGWWIYFCIAWLLPLVFFYQVSNTLRLCVKHTFPAPGITERRGRAYFSALTHAIFIGERAPDAGPMTPHLAFQWVRWSLRMIFIHFPSRYLVLTGDTVVHDFHHRNPASRRWADYIFVRQQDEDEGHKGWPAYTHDWSLRAAMDRVFQSISVADPTEFDPSLIASASSRELFAAFDD